MWFTEADKDGATKEHGKTWATKKYFCVFNAEQCEGIELPKEEANAHEPLAECEKIVTSMPLKPAITHDDKTRAFYQPAYDTVNVPELKYFDTPETYYATMFHELGHSTGHITRIGRKEVVNISNFGSHDYSKEELCAESCAAFLCGIAGIQTERTITNAKAYIKGWLSALKNDRTLLIYGIQQGQKAADYILGIKPEYED
jgi:antirestriction protein ArdC